MYKLPFNIDLKNKVAVVTGGGGVLCTTLAASLAANGSKIAILDLNIEAAQKAANSINQKGYTAIAIQANVLDKESLTQAAQQVEQALGRCDILLNGAGGNHPKGTTAKEFLEQADLADTNLASFYDLDQKSIEFVFNLNFIGTLLPTQVFTQQMLGKTHCTVINISSMNAFRPLTKIIAYSAAKASISNLTQWLAVHFSKVGIRVNALAPGFFLTNQNHSLLINESDGSYTPRAEKIIAHTPQGRFGQPEELIGTLLWLVSHEASSFVNGIVVPIDGGFSAYSGV